MYVSVFVATSNQQPTSNEEPRVVGGKNCWESGMKMEQIIQSLRVAAEYPCLFA